MRPLRCSLRLDRGAALRGPGILRSAETGTHPSQGVFVAADVHYLASGGARAAADPAVARPAAGRTAVLPGAEPCQPGPVLPARAPAAARGARRLDPMALLIIDGDADLDPDGRPGLGARARGESGVPVTGVAKTAHGTATHAIPVRRGTSARPLYVTAAGMAPHRRRRPRPAHGRPAPAARRPAPRR
jgi:deoxyribonuclease V